MTKVAIPTSGPELEATLNDSAKMKEIFDQGGIGEFI